MELTAKKTKSTMKRFSTEKAKIFPSVTTKN